VRDIGKELCGIVTFTVEGVTCPDVKSVLAARGTRVSLTPAAGGSRYSVSFTLGGANPHKEEKCF
jgi:hypothetical protein